MKGQFGKSIRKEFPLDQQYINLNHGSYGVEPIIVQQSRQKYIEQINKNPDEWFRFKSEKEIEKNRQILSQYINCDVESLIFSRNATQAFSDVLNSIHWNQGDNILYSNVAYINVKNQLYYLKEKKGVNLIQINYTKELLNDTTSLLNEIENFINKNKNIKAFVFDHISSTPALIFPVESISALCKKYNIISICDGAHTVGQLPLNLKQIDVDFYLSNLHKWFYTPRSFAFLYINKKFHKDAFPAVIGFYFKDNNLAEKFYQQGTVDNSLYLTIQDALNFRNKLGENNIINYNRNLSWEIGQKVKQIWGTELLIEKRELLSNMVNVEIPFGINDESLINTIIKQMNDQYNFCFPIFKFQGRLYARFSAQIYNDLNDYIYAAEQSLQYFKQIIQQQKQTPKL